MADDVAALIGALDLERPLVLGCSDGGQIALEVGMRYTGLAGVRLGGPVRDLLVGIGRDPCHF